MRGPWLRAKAAPLQLPLPVQSRRFAANARPIEDLFFADALGRQLDTVDLTLSDVLHPPVVHSRFWPHCGSPANVPCTRYNQVLEIVR